MGSDTAGDVFGIPLTEFIALVTGLFGLLTTLLNIGATIHTARLKSRLDLIQAKKVEAFKTLVLIHQGLPALQVDLSIDDAFSIGSEEGEEVALTRTQVDQIRVEHLAAFRDALQKASPFLAGRLQESCANRWNEVVANQNTIKKLELELPNKKDELRIARNSSAKLRDAFAHELERSLASQIHAFE